MREVLDVCLSESSFPHGLSFLDLMFCTSPGNLNQIADFNRQISFSLYCLQHLWGQTPCCHQMSHSFHLLYSNVFFPFLWAFMEAPLKPFTFPPTLYENFVASNNVFPKPMPVVLVVAASHQLQNCSWYQQTHKLSPKLVTETTVTHTPTFCQGLAVTGLIAMWATFRWDSTGSWKVYSGYQTPRISHSVLSITREFI